MANRLSRETSPYLLQHAHNPVDWYPWGEEALAAARSRNRPILLSIGYSACHWCHVMERESFEDPAIARLMNEGFVNVKVDREERPDLDEVYMRAVQLLTGRGGWPLTVFLTPDGKPFYGGTYFPPADRHGMPGLPRVLEAVARAYRERPDDVTRTVEQLVSAVARLEEAVPAGDRLDPALPRRAATALLEHVDRTNGGLGGAPKFPHVQAFQLLLRHHRATGDRDALDAVLLTCRRMAGGGMYDQIGGGFHRYAVDAAWAVPHFEKMLYDNAQLPRLYLEAFQVTGESWLGRVVVETLDYVLREMRHPGGGFYAASDADSEGEEGKFYLWTPAEVARVVDSGDVDLACRHWGLREDGGGEGGSIPTAAVGIEELGRTSGRSTEDVSRALVRARQQLLEARGRRVPPLRDEKILVAWNGLMIGTLAEAGRVLAEPRFTEAASRAAGFLWDTLRVEGRLRHHWTAGQPGHAAYLDDHAFLAGALIDLYEATGERTHLERARALVAALDERFHDDARGAYFFTARDAEPLLTRLKPGGDGSLPSGNAVAAHVLLRLSVLTGEDRLRARAEEIVRLQHGSVARSPVAYATVLGALEFLVDGPTEVVIVGRRGAVDTSALWAVVAATYLPHRVLVPVEPGETDPPAPARGRPALDGRATAYVCRHATCSAPVTEPEQLRQLLGR